MPNFFDEEKYVLHYENLKLYLRLGLTMFKTIYRIQHTKKTRSRKNRDKDGKALYKLRSNAVYNKTMENLRNRIDIKLVKNKKDYLKCISKPSYISHKIFDNLVVIRKSKVSLKLNKPV